MKNHKKIIAGLNLWKGERVGIKKLTGGQTNHIYLVVNKKVYKKWITDHIKLFNLLT